MNHSWAWCSFQNRTKSTFKTCSIMRIWHYTTTIIFLTLIVCKSKRWLTVKTLIHWSINYTLFNGVLMTVSHDISFVIIRTGKADHAWRITLYTVSWTVGRYHTEGQSYEKSSKKEVHGLIINFWALVFHFTNTERKKKNRYTGLL